MSSGGDGILTITGFGRFEKLHAEHNKILIANEKLKEQLKKVTAESKKADDAQGEMLDGMLGKVTKLAAGYMTVQTAIGLASSVLQKHIELTNRAADASVKLADAQSELIVNIGASANDAQRTSITEQGKKLGVETGMGAAGASRMLALITGAIRDPSPVVREQVGMKVGRMVAPYFPNPDDHEKAGQLGAAVLNIQAMAPGISEEQALTVAQVMLANSQLKGAGEIKDLMRGVNASTSLRRDVSDRYTNLTQTSSMAAALTQSLGDQEGRLSATAIANFTKTFEKVTGGKYKNMPLGDAFRLAAAEVPNFSKQMDEALAGEAVTQGAQRDLFLQGYTDLNARAIQGEFATSPEQVRKMFDFAAGGTEELKRAKMMRESTATNELNLASKMGDEGAIRRILFGGEDDPGYYGARGETWLDLKRRELQFAAWRAVGYSAKDIGLSWMKDEAQSHREYYDVMEGMLGRKMTPEERHRQLEAERRASQIEKLGEVIQDNTTMTSNGQNAQAAAAQRNAQVE